jgi:hypothetical protein
MVALRWNGFRWAICGASLLGLFHGSTAMHGVVVGGVGGCGLSWFDG